MPTLIRPQNTTLTGAVPLDVPTPDRPHRLYVATSNHCNRSCPWCCTCSSPKGQTFLDLERYRASFPASGRFEVQLEGGEPTLHPHFVEMVQLARAEPRCTRIVIVTNGVVIPRRPAQLGAWLEELGEPLTIKLSINHYLLEHDDDLLDLASILRQQMSVHGRDRQLVLNVRLRNDTQDAWIVEAVRRAGLVDVANVFCLQRYGFARQHEDWAEPFFVGTHFTMLNPDGRDFGTDLIARSEAMRALP